MCVRVGGGRGRLFVTRMLQKIIYNPYAAETAEISRETSGTLRHNYTVESKHPITAAFNHGGHPV